MQKYERIIVAAIGTGIIIVLIIFNFLMSYRNIVLKIKSISREVNDMISNIRKPDTNTGRYSINAEKYDSCAEMLKDLQRRVITDPRFHNVQEDKLDAKWCGVKSSTRR